MKAGLELITRLTEARDNERALARIDRAAGREISEGRHGAAAAAFDLAISMVRFELVEKEVASA